ncbi:endonuclease/exonuclease/phosphatase family protein [uncultured Demequina sp.]|uniref:endonuclease/exonuclease/phosphatase family protein n=1 Tax=uncultured Demequina sp. TaxID=693499 RepID=UPI0025D6E4A2|nr:endonuclease/exonuclease/phosphatase family protein [uncultured Demequina sp.]
MHTAQRRVLGVTAVAAWLLLDAIRAAGPLVANLLDTSTLLALGGAVAVFAAGGVLAWVCALAGRHFGHGVVLLFMLGLVGITRLGMPLVGGGWLVAAGLYLAALALTTMVLAARVALGNGGSGPLVAGTMLGIAAAIAEQTVLRTWDAVWRGDLWGWIALGGLALLALINGWRCRHLEPVASSRGWWSYGLLWGLIAVAFGNLAWIAAQTGLRTSATSALAIVSLVTGAVLAAQVRRVSAVVTAVLAATGLAAVWFLVADADAGLATGGAAAVEPAVSLAAIALPIAVAVTALAAAQIMRPAHSSVARRLGAATVFGLAILLPAAGSEAYALVDLPGAPGWVLAASAAAVIAVAVWRAFAPQPAPGSHEPADADAAMVEDGGSEGREAAAVDGDQDGGVGDPDPAPWIAPGVLLRAGLGLVVAAGAYAWTSATYEQPRALSADFLNAPTIATWNINGGVQPGITGGPAVELGEMATALVDGATDVMMLQEVERGSLLSGGADTLEFLAGEIDLPYAYAGGHHGVALFTSRAHTNPRSLALPAVDGPRDHAAVAVDFMGATYATTRLAGPGLDADRATQADQLITWLDAPQPTIVGGDLGAEPGTPVPTAFKDAGFVSAQDTVGTPGPTYLGTDPSGSAATIRDYVLGRGVEFSVFGTVGVPWSDHLPVVTRGATGAVAPTDTDTDVNEPQPEAGPSASPTPTASASPSAEE